MTTRKVENISHLSFLYVMGTNFSQVIREGIYKFPFHDFLQRISLLLSWSDPSELFYITLEFQCQIN